MENTNVKLTKVQKFGMLVKFLATEEGANSLDNMFGDTFTSTDATDFLNREIELLVKKATGGKKAKAADVLKDAIVEVLANATEPMNGAQVLAEVQDACEDVTQAKVTSRLSTLVRNGLATKEAIRVGKSNLQHYSLVKGE